MVKLWVVLWSMLADFNQARYQWFDDYAEQGLAEDATYIFGGICVMYILTPAIAGIVVALLDHTAVAVSNALGFMPQGGAAGSFIQNMSGKMMGESQSGGGGNVMQNVTNLNTLPEAPAIEGAAGAGMMAV
jgi:hypothetical protein